NILLISSISHWLRRARLRHVFAARGSLPSPMRASRRVLRDGTRRSGWPRIRRAKATRPRRQFANEADAIAPSNRRESKRKFGTPAGKANLDLVACKTKGAGRRLL